MRTLVIGCNHRSAPVALREKLAFNEAETDEALRRFRAEFPEAEAVLLSTCNRVELYCVRPIRGHPRIGEAIEFITRFHRLDAADFSGVFYSHEDAEAVRHLFRVASSLDSMVVGESQILAQTRVAFEAARRLNAVGRTLGELFPRALGVAKEIHTRTAIATGRVSVGSVAVDLARQVFSRFDDKIVLMVGAGKMGEVALHHLLGTRPRALWVANRTHERAVDLADRIARRHAVAVEVVPYAEWVDRLAAADIVISSTGSREPILTAERFRPIPSRRHYRPLLIIDIAVPRDVEDGVGRQDGVFLYNIDDLQIVTDATLAQRREAMTCCREIIEDHLVQYLESQSRHDLSPLIHALQEHFHGIADQELQWLLPKLGAASEHDRLLIQQMLHRVMRKVLHGPLDLLTQRTSGGAAGVYADMLRAMFDLKTEDQAPPPPGPMTDA